MTLAIVCALCAGLFAGAAVYISAVEHPARLACGTVVAAKEFGPSYRRAAVMQASLAIIGCLAGIAAWATAGGAWVRAGALLLGSVVPFTLVAFRSTNTRLLDPALDAGTPAAASLLCRWGRLHAVRSVAGALAFALAVAGLAAR